MKKYPILKVKPMKTKLLILAVASAFVIGACNNNPPKPKESTETADEHNDAKFEDNQSENAAEFLVKVAEKGMLEVELGKLAEQKGQMPEVRSFGKMMVEHHTKINNELKGLAESKNITLPTTLNEESREKLAKLTAKTGKEFDEEYIECMEESHEKMISKFEDKAGKEKWDADITTWLGNTLPTLRAHLAEIKSIDDKHDAMKK
jgi:putative membrane protein